MKWLKIAGYALGGLVLVVLAIMAFVALTFDPNAYKGEIEKQVKERTGRTLKFHGDIGLAFWPSIGAKVGKVTLSRRASEHDFAAFDAAHVSVRLLPLLRGEVLVNEVSVTGLKASVIRAKGGRFDFEDLTGAAGAGPAPAKPAPGGASAEALKFDIAGVRLKDASFTYLDEGTGQRLSLDDVNLTTGRIADGVPGKLSLGARVRGKNPDVDLMVALDGTYRLGLSSKAHSLSGLRLKVDGAAGEFSRIALEVAGDVGAQLAKQAVDADLTAKFDQTAVKAKLGLAGFDAPHYRFDIDVDQIDLDRYLVAQPGAKPAPSPDRKGTSAGEKVEIDVPIDLSPLEGLKADGKLAIGRLKLMNLRIAELKASLHAAGGRAELAPHSAKLYEGALQGALTLVAKGNRVALKEDLSGIAIGPLLKDLMGRDALEGRGKVALDVTTAGPTVGAMKKALAGSARMELTDGAVKGINLAEALRKTKAAFGSKSAREQASDTSERTDFSEMSASFALRNGVAHNDDLSVKAPILRIGGAGDVDIGASRLDYLARATVVATSKGQGGADLDHLAGLTIPVKLSGTFDAPKYEIDYRKLADEAAKSKVKQELKEKVQPKLEQKLRNLFKR
ncbi:MAG TPA: AsmA family protein [Burkholderiales bacterium]|nr:AsmA family protein [Burkholderiales bacterium]